jgi:HEAT repeat protein
MYSSVQWLLPNCTLAMQTQVCQTESKRNCTERDLIIKLRTGVSAERVDAAKRLGESRAKSAVPQLIHALEDKNQYVRSWAAWALGEIKDRRAIDPLINSLDKYLRLAKTDYFGKETKCITSLYLALESITGKKYGRNIEKWKNYQKETKEEE